jgi:hypothetical protein
MSHGARSLLRPPALDDLVRVDVNEFRCNGQIRGGDDVCVWLRASVEEATRLAGRGSRPENLVELEWRRGEKHVHQTMSKSSIREHSGSISQGRSQTSLRRAAARHTATR